MKPSNINHLWRKQPYFFGLKIAINLLVRALTGLLILAGLVAVGLLACGSDHPSLVLGSPAGATGPTDTVADQYFAPPSTGSTKEIKTPDGTTTDVSYTPAGETEEFKQLQQDVQGTNDKLMSKSVQAVNVILLNGLGQPLTSATTTSGTAQVAPPAKIQMAIKFDPQSGVQPQELDFLVPMTLSNGVLSGQTDSTTNALTGVQFSADLSCLEVTCDDIEIRVNKHVRDASGAISPTVSDLGIMFRQTHPMASVQKSVATSTYKDPGLQSLQELPKEVQADRTSVSVVDGPSFSNITVPSSTPGQDVVIQTDLTDTQGDATTVNSVSIPQSTGIQGQLVGNNPDTGSITVDLTQPQTDEVERINIVEAPATPKPIATSTPQAVIDEVHNRPNSTRLVNVPTDTSTNAAQVSNLLAAYANDPEVQRVVGVWLGKPDRRTCPAKAANNTRLKELLQHGPPVAPYVEQIAGSQGVTPEIIYLLPLESNYILDQARPIQPGPGSSALGPWMILYGTAEKIKNDKSIPFNLYNNVHGPANSNDDRAFFLNATYLASLYLNQLFSKFTDPGLAILAYTAGDGGAEKAAGVKDQTQVYTQFDTSLPEILKENIQTRKNCGAITYAYEFLSLRTIGQNLDVYHLDNVQADKTLNTNHLKNPKGPLPSGLSL